MKKVFLGLFLFSTVFAFAVRTVSFRGTCGIVETKTFADGTTNAQIADAYRAWNWNECHTEVKRVAITSYH